MDLKIGSPVDRFSAISLTLLHTTREDPVLTWPYTAGSTHPRQSTILLNHTATTIHVPMLKVSERSNLMEALTRSALTPAPMNRPSPGPAPSRNIGQFVRANAPRAPLLLATTSITGRNTGSVTPTTSKSWLSRLSLALEVPVSRSLSLKRLIDRWAVVCSD